MRRARSESGAALSSSVALVSAAAVVVTGAAYLLTGPEQPVEDRASTASASAPTESVQPPVTVRRTEPARPARPARPAVDRARTYVEVYNNSGISGLAGATAERLSGVGWQVVGADNWSGIIPASTVYYPPRLEREARLLAKDIGLSRLMPAEAPMRLDRLTVILTGDTA